MMKAKLYSLLMNPHLKRSVRLMDQFLQRRVPGLHKRVFLPFLARAKRRAAACSAGALPEKRGEVVLWPAQPEERADFLVSVIVPNYNHGAYLRERLESLYRQTYGNYEVILLDDCSTDGSRDILEEYRRRYPERTRLILNERNSGNVFAQWKKGLSLARGELVWIAESDDWCQPNFLEQMVQGFSDPAVMLAFCRSDFMREGVRTFSTEDYLREFSSFDWSKPFCITAAQFVAQAFSVKNVIPNVSSAVFRKPVTFSEELEGLWADMRLCGDWAFYLEMLKGGCLFYTPETTNYYRIHAESTSLRVQEESRYYEEHGRIARYLVRNYRIPLSSSERHLRQLEAHCLSHGGGKGELDRWFSLEELALEERRPNVLMCLFSMSVGGGETFPLVLANELKRQGIPVTLLDFQLSEDVPGVRSRLRPDVPYIRLSGTEGLVSVAFQLGTDIIHSHHGVVAEAVHYALLSLPELRHITTLHGMYETIEGERAFPMLEHLRETCRQFVYIADKNLLPFQEHGGFDFHRFVKIGNGLEYSEGTPIPRGDLGIPEDAFVLCLVSRAIPEKGWQAAVDGVLLARKTAHRDIHLLLVGDGEMYQRLKGKVPSCIHLMGFRPNVRDYLATSDMGLLPSEYKGESFPLMIIDCLFCGRPVIVSNLGESRNQLMDEEGEPAGVVFDLHDGKVPVEELSGIIRRAADDGEYYDTLRGRVASASQKFRMERVAEKYVETYRKIV